MRWILVFIATLVASPMAEAQPPATPPDIVVLHSGGMMRGTISESVPGSQVVIVTLTGDARTIPWADVEYAGPASGYAPPAPASSEHTATTSTATAEPVQELREGEVMLHVETVPRGVVVESSRVGGARPALLCVGPCDEPMRPGRYWFGIQLAPNNVLMSPDAFVIETTSRLLVTRVSRLGTRIAGGIIGGIVLAGGASALVGSLVADLDTEYAVGSTGIALIGILLLITMTGQKDGVAVQLDPLRSPGG